MAPVILRHATRKDAGLLFLWRNDPLTCAMSNNSAPVAWEKHVWWLGDRLARPQPHLYIAMQCSFTVPQVRTPVGVLRLDDDLLSYTVAPEVRGQGIARRLLKEARDRFGILRAQIKPENIASIRAAESAGHKVELI